MIDLHSHILHGIDDGPKSIRESLALAKLYAAAGFSGVVATPHWIPGTAYAPDRDTILSRVADLNGLLKENGIGLTVYPGMEIAMDGCLYEFLDGGRLLSLADGPYVLIETPFQRLPVDWAQMVSTIRARGCDVLLAHPERCLELGRHPEVFEEIIDAGVFLQVNYDSILGGNGSAVAETAAYLLERGFIHCLATDSHNTTHRHPGSVAEASGAVETVIGIDQVRILTTHNPRRVTEGLRLEKIGPVECNRKRKRRWFWF